MGTYRQYCPIARASEILAERWNPLIVRNLMFGANTFSAIAGGVPTMSRSMLIKRLDELERAGLIQSRPKPGGRGHVYELTEAGADLAGVLDGLAAWGEHWVEVEHGDAEVCYTDPGGEPDLTIEARSLAFVDWHRGERSWRDVLRSGDVMLIGPTWLRRSFPTWNRHAPVLTS